MMQRSAYPAAASARDAFVVARRGPRPVHDVWRPQGVLVEREADGLGETLASATFFLTGRECPWRCVMCDLWQHTVPEATPTGAIAQQVAAAWAQVVSEHAVTPAQVKLYNASSFFDPTAVPDADYEAMAHTLRDVGRIVVEAHPSLVLAQRGARLRRLVDVVGQAGRDGRRPQVAVAMGLETAHPGALERLNKRITPDTFRAAAEAIRAAGATVRVFVLVGVPFIAAADQRSWTRRSVAFALACGARVVSLIPTRRGNGALEALEAQGHFVPPRLTDLEQALHDALAEVSAPAASERRPIVLADLWDIEQATACAACRPQRAARLQAMNLAQAVRPRVECDACRIREGAA